MRHRYIDVYMKSLLHPNNWFEWTKITEWTNAEVAQHIITWTTATKSHLTNSSSHHPSSQIACSLHFPHDCDFPCRALVMCDFSFSFLYSLSVSWSMVSVILFYFILFIILFLLMIDSHYSISFCATHSSLEMCLPFSSTFLFLFVYLFALSYFSVFSLSRGIWSFMGGQKGRGKLKCGIC